VLNSLFNFFNKLTTKSIVVRAVRMKRNHNRSGKLRYQIKAYVRGRVIASQELSACYSPQQYEVSLSKLLAKIYRRYRWLIGSITYLPAMG